MLLLKLFSLPFLFLHIILLTFDETAVIPAIVDRFHSNIAILVLQRNFKAFLPFPGVLISVHNFIFLYRLTKNKKAAAFATALKS